MPFRIKATGCLLVLFIFCGTLWGCAEQAPEETVLDWTESPAQEIALADTGIVMEMALEAYGPLDSVVSYIIINTTQDPVTFTNDFSLEYSDGGKWLTIPFRAEAEQNETYTLPGMQLCKIEVNLSLFAGPFPEGLYRIVREVGSTLYSAEFIISSEPADIREMMFGHVPLSSLPEDYDGIDAQSDGYYTIIEDGIFNQEAVQFFTDRVHLGIPGKLRTVMHTEDGAVLIRDIIFAPDADGNGRFFVILDESRKSEGTEQVLSERVYSSLSIARVGNKNKVCLSNYVSYSADAPTGAPLELISPDAAENIDLVATVELRTEENVRALPYMFLIYGPDNESFATIQRGGNTFGYRAGEVTGADIQPDQPGFTILAVKWMSGSQLLLSGTTADGQSHQITYELDKSETDIEPDM